MSAGWLRWTDGFFKRGTLFWVLPTLGMVAALMAAPLTRLIDARMEWKLFEFTPQGASSVLSALTAAMFTFVVFVITSLLLVVQLASAQLTPRIILLSFESRHIRLAITAFTFSFTYTVAVNGRMSERVPQLGTAIAVLSCLISIALFFYFANRLAVDLRPVSVLTRVGTDGCRIIDAVYPNKLGPDAAEDVPQRLVSAKAAKIVTYAGRSGSVLRFNPAAIVLAAVEADVVVEMVPQVGDFIALGDPLFRVSAGRSDLADADLRACVVVGPERTLDQDPRFSFRIIVDIANKALSPAINDPTTAVLAIDQIHRMLLATGRRRLDGGEVRDAGGRIRLVYGTPDWDDYVALGVSEIRHFGAGSIQVARRLFALLTHLIQVLPARRAEPLRREQALLRDSVLREFPDADDRARAQVADTQGMGGAEPIGEPSALETVPPSAS